MEKITEEQHFLASKAGISIEESNCLSDFEKDAFVNITIKNIYEKEKILSQKKGK